MTKEQEAALDKLAQASRTKVVQQVRDLGHYPKANAGRSLAERQLAWKLRNALNAKQFSSEQEAELQALRPVQQVRDLGGLKRQVHRYPKEPAPDPFLNPPSKRHPLGDFKLRILRKRIYTLGKLVDRRDRAAASSCPIRDHAFTRQLQWAWEGEEEEEKKRVDPICIRAVLSLIHI